MQYDPPSMQACPHCGGAYFIMDLYSSNTFGSTLHSDGYLHNPNMSMDTGVMPCRHCGKPFFREDMVLLLRFIKDRDTDPRYKDNPAFQNLPTFWGTLDPQVLAPLADQQTDPERRRRLHVFTMWGDNHTENTRSTEEKRENLRQLLDFLDAESHGDTCMGADALRQLGRFEECIARLAPLLADPDAQAFHPAARLIQEAARAGNREVFVVRAGVED